ncbi:MAG: ATP-binding protein [Anaerolineae bacterium]
MTQLLRVLIGSGSAADGRWWLNELTRIGYEPVGETVHTLDDLAAALGRQEWDLLLADPAMPGFDVHQIVAWIAARDLDLPLIVALTAYDADRAIAMLEAGAHDCVAKDQVQCLAATVHRELRHARDRRGRRQAQEALAASEALHRALFERADHAIFITDPDTGRILDANPAASALVGRPHAELCTMHLEQLYPPEMAAAYRIMFDAHARQSNHAPLEACVRHADGHDVLVEINVHKIQVNDRAVVLSAFRDVSDHVRISRQEAAERQTMIEAAAARTRQLSALNELGLALAETLDLNQVCRIAYEHVTRLADADGFAISLYDPIARTLKATYVVSDGRPVDVSVFPPIVFTGEPSGGRARAIARKEPEVVLKHRSANRSLVIIGDEPLSAAYVPMVVKGEVTGLLEVQSQRAEAYGPAEVAWLGPAANLIGMAIENARLYQAVQRELNERRRAEAALQHTLEELKRSNADLEQFAYVASHDLQEPLRMVASFVQLLGERYRGRLDDDADDFIAFAVEGATRMQMLINDLLEYSRVDRFGRLPEPTDAEEVLARTLQDMELTIAESGATITYDPLPIVMADDTQLERVLQNLIGNAIKFHGPEPPRVHISANETTDEATGRRFWRFAVRDNGIGIDPQFHERIFRIFQRLHSRREYEGTGIGLAVCKRVIERHGGRIWVESQPGKGSTFYFTLPAVEDADK